MSTRQKLLKVIILALIIANMLFFAVNLVGAGAGGGTGHEEWIPGKYEEVTTPSGNTVWICIGPRSNPDCWISTTPPSAN